MEDVGLFLAPAFAEFQVKGDSQRESGACWYFSSTAKPPYFTFFISFRKAQKFCFLKFAVLPFVNQRFSCPSLSKKIADKCVICSPCSMAGSMLSIYKGIFFSQMFEFNPYCCYLLNK